MAVLGLSGSARRGRAIRRRPSTAARRTFLPPVVMRTSLTTCAGAFFGVVSASQPLGSDSRMTLCQALATCLYSGAE